MELMFLLYSVANAFCFFSDNNNSQFSFNHKEKKVFAYVCFKEN